MLCSDCKKNNAVVFINKKDNDGKTPADVASREDLKQLLMID